MASILFDLLLFATPWAHVLIAPYTKVEESFNLHATHDVLMYGVSHDALPNFDHFVFPGAVPRTFVGGVLLAWLSTPVIHAADALDLLSSKFDLQIIVRLVLATCNTFGLLLLRRAVRKRFGRQTSNWFVLLSMSQFHLPFWMGRTLPNMYALLPVNIAHALLLNRPPNLTRPSSRAVYAAIWLLTFATVVFRAELLPLLATTVAHSLAGGHASFSGVLWTGVISGISAAALTTTVDSYFWARWPLWPELMGFVFNVYEGKSSEWGVSPPHAYFSAHLPKLLLSSAPLSILGCLLDSRARTFVLPSILFVALISALGHKEWRFVVYVVPVFNVAAARGARGLLSLRKTFLVGPLAQLILFGLLACNILATYLLTSSSHMNYPGGVALQRLNLEFGNTSAAQVHISNLAAQTGASLFLHEHAPPYLSHPLPVLPLSIHTDAPWVYDKTESLSTADLTRAPYTHLIAESLDDVEDAWEVAGVVRAFDGWSVDGELLDELKAGKLDRVWELDRLLRMRTSVALCIMLRR